MSLATRPGSVLPDRGDPIELSDEQRAFQQEVREWLMANAPAELKGRRMPRYRAPKDLKAVLDDWTKRLHDAGYMCVAWPMEYGGRGLSGVEVALLNEEFHLAQVPRMTRGMGESLVGPSIILHGTEEQKAHFLPRIIDGTDKYCQGFSEPNAGSDLAGLRTRGTVRGDEVVVNGQKVWTSWYWDATMLFCLCRTDDSAPKHKGISYVLIPIHTADGQSNGVEFRPIKQATGEGHFAETFITDAKAPLFNVIGGLNSGWKVAMTTLGNERGGGATTQHTQFEEELRRLVDDARRLGKLSDPLVRERLAWAYCNVEILRMSGVQLLNALATGQDPGPAGSASINKIRWSEYERRLLELALDILGPESLVAGEDYQLSHWQQTFLQTRTHTIWGGTAEIQRNIIAERVLGLPKEVQA